MIVTHQKPERKNQKITKKIKTKTVLIAEDSMLNSIEERELSKTKHIRVQPIPGGKMRISKKILMIYYMKNYKR